MRRRLLTLGTAWLFLGILPVPARAQQFTLAEARPDAVLASSRVDVPAADSSQTPAQRVETRGYAEPELARPASRRLLLPLYVSAAALQMMDVHSTRRALAAGHVEANPLMSGIASNTTAFVAVKAATAAGAILMSEKLRTRNRVAAVGLMVAVNAATAAIVAHNYRIGR